MIKLKYSESHPLKSHLVNEQYLTKEKFIAKFEAFDWFSLLKELNAASEHQIECSPSLNLDDDEGKSITVSIVGNAKEFEFYVRYKRPTTVKRSKWLGLVKYDYFDKDFCSVIPQQSKQDGLDAFLYFYDRNFEELEKRW